MKITKLLLFSIFIFYIKFSEAQPLDFDKSNTCNSVFEKYTPTTFYTEDFQNGLNNGWQVFDSAGFNENWQYTTVGPAGTGSSIYDKLQSPTASNGFMMIDDDAYGNNNTTTVTALMSNVIDCSGKNKVRLRFYHYYKHYTGCEARIYASNNQSSWQLIQTLSAGMQSLQNTTNPNEYEIDISGVAANQSTVNLLFVYKGNWGYFWEIDDVSLYEPDQIDAALISVNGMQSTCATNTADTLQFEATNLGYQSFSVLPVGYTINGGAVQTQNFSQLMSQLQKGSFSFSPALAFATAGKYEIKIFTQLAGDQNNSNDTLTTTIYVGPVDIKANSYFAGFEPNEDVSNWKTEDTDGDGITCDFPVSYARTGIRCLRMPWAYNLDTIAENWIFSDCIKLEQGFNYNTSFYYRTANDTLKTYDIGVFICNSQSSFSVVKSIGVIAAQNDTFYKNFATNFNVNNTGTYYLAFKFSGINVKCARRIDDLNISYVTGLQQNHSSNAINLYPNPSQNHITIEVSEPQLSDYVIYIFDPLGTLIASKTSMQQRTQLDVSNLSCGIYSVQVITSKGVSNFSFVKE